jgi:ubiquinol-cytochrome c reductase cytochrome c subunit
MMTLSSTSLRVAVLALTLGASSAVHVAAQGPAPPATAAASAAPAGDSGKGKTLFRKIACYQCHSEQAQGGTQGPRLGPNPIPFRAFSAYLRAPKGEMPPYTEKVMSDQDVADVYAFLRALPPPPPLSTLPLLQP